jgi:CubicO group peptidase (beta-lactamase class C family)
MSTLQGVSDPRFDRLREAIEANLANGTEIGLSLCVDVDGESIVDVWGGWRDRERTVAWTEDTIVNVWSTTKAVTSLAVLMLVDQGDLDVYAPVTKYWPEFGQNGKEAVEVRHLLSHTSGVSGWELPFAPEQMFDVATSTAKLAGQAPWWEPGSAAGYHANNFGHLNGELVRRVTGKTLGQFVAEEIAAPLNADFHIGLADEDVQRVATIYGPPTTTLPAPRDDVAADWPIQRKTLAGCFTVPSRGNDADFRRAEIGATNGHGNARALARMLAAVSNGGTSQGVQLLSPDTIDLIFDVQSDGVDLVLALPLRWGIGFALESAGVPYVRGSRTCFWGGWGGSMGIMDVERHVTIGYAMNQMQPATLGSDVAAQYISLIDEALRDV